MPKITEEKVDEAISKISQQILSLMNMKKSLETMKLLYSRMPEISEQVLTELDAQIKTEIDTIKE